MFRSDDKVWFPGAGPEPQNDDFQHVCSKGCGVKCIERKNIKKETPNRLAKEKPLKEKQPSFDFRDAKLPWNQTECNMFSGHSEFTGYEVENKLCFFVKFRF